MPTLSPALGAVLVLIGGCLSVAAGCGGGAGAPPSDAPVETPPKPDAGSSTTVPIGVSDAGGNIPDLAEDAGDDGASALQGACGDDASDYIYLLTQGASSDVPTLYRFGPASLTFERLGQPACLTSSTLTLAIDHAGTAWTTALMGGAFHLIQIGLPGLGCVDTGPVTAPANETLDEIAFAGTSPATESLYVLPEGTTDVWALDVVKRTVTTDVGSFTGSFLRGSLTGSGGGELFALVQGGASTSYQALKPGGGALPGVPLPIALGSKTQPMAFWGGDLWIFLYEGGADEGGSVVRYQPATGMATTVVEHVVAALDNKTVFGAAVSTCAPLVPPQPR